MSGQLKEMQSGASSKTQISDLPSCLVKEILSRVPLATLSSSCRYVCTDWFKLTDASLVLPLLEKLPTCLVQKEIPETGDILFGWVVEDEANAIDDGGRFHIQMGEFSTKLEIPISELRCINSCNGLLCLQEIGYNPGDIYVCNPVLGEWISIPCWLPGEYGEESPEVKVALGFSPASNRYKLLRTSSTSEMEGEGEIYTIGTGRWRGIGRTSQIFENFNTFLNGSLHWLDGAVGDDGSRSICSFSFEDEVSRPIPMPKTELFILMVELGVLDGCLCASFCEGHKDQDTKIWVMKEYGVEESWTQLAVISVGIPGSITSCQADKIFTDGLCSPCYHDLLFSLNAEDGEMLVSELGGFVAYNARRKTSWTPQVVGHVPPMNPDICVWAAFNPSLVSLRGVAKGEEVTVCSVRTKMKIFSAHSHIDESTNGV